MILGKVWLDRESLREQLKDCSAAFDRQQEMLDRNTEQIAALREHIARMGKSITPAVFIVEQNKILREQLKECHENGQSEYICTCGIRVTPHKCPTDNGF